MRHHTYVLVDSQDRVCGFINIFSDDPVYIKSRDCYAEREAKLRVIKRVAIEELCAHFTYTESQFYALCEVVR